MIRVDVKLVKMSFTSALFIFVFKNIIWVYNDYIVQTIAQSNGG